MLRMLAVPVLALVVAGCASKSSDISASYVSPIMYQSHSCQQLAQEAQGVSSRAAQVSGAQDSKRTSDAVATGVAIVIFWPAAFLVGGDGPTASELAQLKGQMVAIEQASIQKNCTIAFQRTAETGAPVVTQMQPPPAPPVAASGKQTSSARRAATKQNLSQPQQQQTTIIVAEPAAPALSETDRTMMQRN